ncbi:Topless-related protein 1 [Carex littledalei]|uniref:Topless-related protein 1 n=1 Tax=Carex littledalei TaxID=544730 RepID=A0A833QQB1_9POAL|nr:Topless-related protein 1 [Carex littledalei]
MSGNQGQGAGPASMSRFNKEIIFIVLQFLYEQGFHETAHRLERDSQLYFNLKYFEELILAGQWAEVEWYLRGYFMDVRGNSHGLKLIFETYKQKFYEALYWHQREEALNILDTEFRSILSPNEDIYKELIHLFSLMDFREHPLLKEWDNPQKARATLCAKMRNLVLKCPDLKDKIHFPTIPRSRLLSLVYQSFNWQHSLCERRLPNAAMATLLTDHNCSELMPPPSLMSASLLHRPTQNFTPLPSLSLSFTADPSRLAIDVRGAANDGVGTSLGEVLIWDLSSKERIHKKCFGLLDNPAFSAAIQDALDKEDGFFSVRRVLWSTDGCHFVVAYCKHLVQMYKFSGKSDLQCTFEIDAHKGGLNDIAFSQPIHKMFIVTSGDDGAIRVWSSVSGLLLHTFGADHSAPVLSICPRSRGFRQYILSASSDGKIKSWRFDKIEPEHEFEGPICSSVSFAATTDGSRLFSCGTIKDGTGSPFLVEYSEPNEGIIKCYLGLSTHTDGALQFDMANDHILAIGDDSIVKFWNVDECEPLYYVDAGGGLPESNVKTSTSGQGTHAPLPPIIELDEEADEYDEAIKDYVSHVNEINEPSQCLSLRLPDTLPGGKIHKLVYANDGESVIALSSNGTHKLWRWNKTCLNPSSKLLLSDGLMVNDVGDVDIETRSFALTKDNRYLTSTSGGPVSLFNVTDAEKLGSFLRPPPVATVLAFHPQNNNRVAIGMDDCTILIFEPQRKKVCCILSGHNKRVTGLCFSTKLDVLVSSGLDAQLCIWKMDTWEKLNSICMELNQEVGGSLAHISVEFHPDGVQLLVVHATQLTVYDAGEMKQLHQVSNQQIDLLKKIENNIINLVSAMMVKPDFAT